MTDEPDALPTATRTPGPGRAHRTVETVFRIESPRIIAAVTRIVRDVGIA